jgi:hypothetical protein
MLNVPTSNGSETLKMAPHEGGIAVGIEYEDDDFCQECFILLSVGEVKGIISAIDSPSCSYETPSENFSIYESSWKNDHATICITEGSDNMSTGFEVEELQNIKLYLQMWLVSINESS